MNYYALDAIRYLKALWKDLAGMKENAPQKIESLESLQRTEWSPRFEQAMRHRLIMGAFRYGKLNSPEKGTWDRLQRISQEIDRYLVDGNDERLVDMANMCLLEFEEGRHPKKHFKAADDKGHNREVKYA